MVQRIRVLDTHTGGEPTRVVVNCPIDLGAGEMSVRRDRFRESFDGYRRAIACEPRGSDVMVGAVLVPPVDPKSLAGVIFFNNVGYLGMCGHGTIGVAVALQYLGRAGIGQQQLDTPVGPVQFELLGSGKVRIQNVASYRYKSAVPLVLGDGRTVHGDIAWGGNWFFICEDHGVPVRFDMLDQLQQTALSIREALDTHQIKGADDEIIDHVELIGAPSSTSVADRRNFVLCPGAAYDRSPCGTGTSAKLACLANDSKLRSGQVYRQESIVGSIFEADYQTLSDGRILPSITGSAYVCGEASLVLDPQDPFCMGINPLR
jgi:4-hydroxyproline epimerase